MAQWLIADISLLDVCPPLDASSYRHHLALVLSVWATRSRP